MHRCRQLKAAFKWPVTEVYVIVQSQATTTLHEPRIASRIMACVMDTSAAAEVRKMMCGGGGGGGGVLDDVAWTFIRLRLHNIVCLFIGV